MRSRLVGLFAGATLLLGLAACSPQPQSDDADGQEQSQEVPSVDPGEDDQDIGSDDDMDDESDDFAEEDDLDEPSGIDSLWTTDHTSFTPSNPEASTALTTGMRVGHHDDFDRVVFDFKGSGELGWSVGWTVDPIEQGRGERIELPGSAFLDIYVQGVAIPLSDEDYEDYLGSGEATLIADDHGISVIYDGTFEGSAHFVIGTDQERPYRVFMLQDPVRVVVDIQN